MIVDSLVVMICCSNLDFGFCSGLLCYVQDVELIVGHRHRRGLLFLLEATCRSIRDVLGVFANTKQIMCHRLERPPRRLGLAALVGPRQLTWASCM